MTDIEKVNEVCASNEVGAALRLMRSVLDVISDDMCVSGLYYADGKCYELEFRRSNRVYSHNDGDIGRVVFPVENRSAIYDQSDMD